MSPIDIECLEFKKIFDENNIKKKILLESLSLNPFWFNQKVARRFQELYKRDLKNEIINKFKDFIKDVLITCLNTKRNDNNKIIDNDEINDKVKLLLNTKPETLSF